MRRRSGPGVSCARTLLAAALATVTLAACSPRARLADPVAQHGVPAQAGAVTG
ncbi:MAG: hypothetical protein JWO37_762, partial [Acidimicrobiales bacterium]|nr:hypothetical protein [Acidimicrobiales bacterium]